MQKRRLLLGLAAVAVVAAVVIGLSQTGTENAAPRPATVARVDPAELPPELGRLARQGSKIVEASPAQVRDQLDRLKGTPVVVNKWASWCGPCRYEFPFLQELAAKYAGRVAFLGINSGDNRQDAERFLRRFPVPYPSFEDPRERIALSLDASAAYPVTIFYDETHEDPFVHAGGYATAEKLEEDLRLHALS